MKSMNIRIAKELNKIAKELVADYDKVLNIAIRNGIKQMERTRAYEENQSKARELLYKKRLSYQGTIFEHHYIYSGFDLVTGKLLSTYFASIFTFYDPADGEGISSQRTVLIVTNIKGKVIKFLSKASSNNVKGLHNEMIRKIQSDNGGCGMYMYDYSKKEIVWKF